MAISLTLEELKEYFKVWHSKISHTDEVKQIMSDYINNITSITDYIDQIIEYINTNSKLLLLISGLTEGEINNLSLQQLQDKLNTQEFKSKLSNINLQNLYTLINNNYEILNNKISNKADKEYVDDEINRLSDNLGVEPLRIQAQTINTNDDLNNYKTPGIYKNDNAGNNIANTPNIGSSTFSLIVIENKEETVNNQKRYNVRQLLLTNSTEDEGNRIFTRNYTLANNKWNDKWHELYGTHNTKTIQMKVEWTNEDNINASTTYTLLGWVDSNE